MSRGRPSRATVYARLEAAIAELKDRLGGLPSPKESEYVWSDIWHLEAHHSTALEGNALVLREVEVLLDKGRAVGASPHPAGNPCHRAAATPARQPPAAPRHIVRAARPPRRPGLEGTSN